MSAITQAELDRLRELFICPISYELFKNPVIENTACSHTFERRFIQQWLVDHDTCPISSGPLRMEQLVSHSILRDTSALLNPINPKKEPKLLLENIDLLRHTEKAFLKRKLQVRVSEKIHDLIAKRAAQIRHKSR